MQGFALFRLPYAQQCTWLSGEVSTVPSCAALSGRCGFVMAPFAPTSEQPVLIIRPNTLTTATDHMPDLPSLVLETLPASTLQDYRIDYHTDFALFHRHLSNGDFQKLVLSRSIDVKRTDDATPTTLFRRACDSYPRMFIALVYTPVSGLWLTATPEILLAGSGSQWQTIALAGTMPFAEQVSWSDKNIQEQRYVATYISRQLERFTDDFMEAGPYTARAGHLAHLRSDFRFSLPDSGRIGDLLQALHPTPAVCGLPKEQAFCFLLQHEHHHRSYYSGFMGPLFVESRTNLFVTLRCMQLFHDGFRLHAGGGLLKDSVEDQEWQETEAKLQTMRNVLN